MAVALPKYTDPKKKAKTTPTTSKDIRSNIKSATSTPVLGPSSATPALGPTKLPFQTAKPVVASTPSPVSAMKYGNTAPTTLQGLQQSASLPTPAPLPPKTPTQTHGSAPLPPQGMPQQKPQNNKAFDAFNTAQDSQFGFMPNQPKNLYGGTAEIGSPASFLEMDKMGNKKVQENIKTQMKDTRNKIIEGVMNKMDTGEVITADEVRTMARGANEDDLRDALDNAMAEGAMIEGLNYEFPVEEKTGLAKTQENFQNRADTLTKQLGTKGATGLEKGLNVAGFVAGSVVDPINQALGYGMEKAYDASMAIDKAAPAVTQYAPMLNPIAAASRAADEVGSWKTGKTTEEGIPETVKDSVLSYVGGNAKKASDRYEKMGKTNPRLKNAIDSGMPIADAVMTFAGIGATGKGIQKGLKTAGKDVLKLGKEIVTEAPGLAKKGLAKAGEAIRKIASPSIAKKTEKVLDMIQEGASLSSKKSALEGGRLSLDKGSTLFGKSSKILSSKQTVDAAESIVSNIDNIAKDPADLYGQLKSKVGEIAQNVSGRMKDIRILGSKTTSAGGLQNIGTSKMIKEIQGGINELSQLTDEFTSSSIKQIKSLSKNVGQSKNLDDIRSSLKKFDDSFSDAVKTATKESAPSTRKANELWMQTRNKIRSFMDDVAMSSADETFKTEFKDMSNMYHAMNNIKSRVSDITKAKKGILSKENIVKGVIGAAGAGVLGKLTGFY